MSQEKTEAKTMEINNLAKENEAITKPVELEVTVEQLQAFEPAIKKKMNDLLRQDKRLKKSIENRAKKLITREEKIAKLQAQIKQLENL